MKDGGKLFIHTPNGEYLLEAMKKNGVLKQPDSHIGIRNNRQYMSLLERVGFKDIKVYYLSHYIWYLSILHFLSYLPLGGNYFKARLLIEVTK